MKTTSSGVDSSTKEYVTWNFGLLIGIVLVITLQIFARTVLGEAFIWPEELAVFLSIYLVFVGAAYNARLDTHIKVSFFAQRMPRLMRFGITFITHLLSGVITEATGMSTYEFAFNNLFKPMGIDVV